MMGASTSKKQHEEPSDPPMDDCVFDCVTTFDETCASDPKLMEFNRSFSFHTKRAVSELTDGDTKALSLNGFKAAMDLFMEGNEAVVKLMISDKKDILKDPVLVSLVEECLNCSKQTLDLCTAFDKGFTTAKQCQFLISEAVRQFRDSPSEEKVTRTCQSLKRFKDLGDPFSKEFSDVFQSVYRHQVTMLLKLTERKKLLEKKIKSLKTWRKVCSVLFMATFVSVLILSVVAAAVAAPPVYAALAGALTVPIGSIGKWCSSLWGKYMKQVKSEMKLVNLMSDMSMIRVAEMDSINNLVKRFELEIETIGNVAELASMEESCLGKVMDQIEQKTNSLTEMVNDLEKRVNDCRKSVKATTNLLLEKVLRGGEDS